MSDPTTTAARRCWNCNVAIPDAWDDVLCADCKADAHAATAAAVVRYVPHNSTGRSPWWLDRPSGYWLAVLR